MSIGAVLAAARQQAGMTIAEVSQQTRIRGPIIQAIESDDFSACGADFYARGHIRAIARAVGVDAEPLVQEYDSRLGTPSVTTAATVSTAAGAPGPPAAPQPRPHQKRNWAVAVVLVLAAGVALISYYAVTSSPAGRAAAADHKPVTAHHAVRKHTATSAQHRGARRLVISVTAVSEPCWAELTTRGGRTIFEGIIGTGTSRTWRLRRAVALRLGNPGAITLRVDGKRHTRLGSDPVTLRLAPGHAPSG